MAERGHPQVAAPERRLLAGESVRSEQLRGHKGAGLGVGPWATGAAQLSQRGWGDVVERRDAAPVVAEVGLRGHCLAPAAAHDRPVQLDLGGLAAVPLEELGGEGVHVLGHLDGPSAPPLRQLFEDSVDLEVPATVAGHSVDWEPGSGEIGGDAQW